MPGGATGFSGGFTQADIDKAFKAGEATAAKVAADNIYANKVKASDKLVTLFKAQGIDDPGFAKFISDNIMNDVSEAQTLIDIYDQPVYKLRFPGMEALRKKNRAITEDAYIKAENQIVQTLRFFDLPVGFYDNRTMLGSIIGNEVSPKEVQDRAQAAQDLAKSTNPEIRKALKEFYNIGEGDITANFLNGDLAGPLLLKQARAAEIAGIAKTTGFDTFTNTEAQGLAEKDVYKNMNLTDLTTAIGNNAIGGNSMQNHITGNGNVANGQSTMLSSRTAIQNTAMGSQAMRSIVLGTGQTAIGREALRDTTSIIATFGSITPGTGYTDGTYTGVELQPNNGSWWVLPTADITVSGGVVTVVTLVGAGIGMVVGATLIIEPTAAPAGLLTGGGFSIPVATVTSGIQNTALGYKAGQNNQTGSRNLFIGYNAGINETTSDNLYISNSTTSTPLIKGKFDSSGGNAGSVRIYGDLQLTTNTPASATATGTVGTITYDNDYIYICIATDTWKRVGIATW